MDEGPNEIRIPAWVGGWEYTETYRCLRDSQKKIDDLITYLSILEKADDESAERLINEITFLSFKLQDCSTQIYKRFLKDKIIKATPPLVMEHLGIPIEVDINYHQEGMMMDSRIANLSKMAVIQNKYIHRIFDFLSDYDLDRTIVENCYEAYEEESKDMLAELTKLDDESPSSNSEA